MIFVASFFVLFVLFVADSSWSSWLRSDLLHHLHYRIDHRLRIVERHPMTAVRREDVTSSPRLLRQRTIERETPFIGGR